jgi:SPP1 gp7 family putative phage head morphogenesis protein
LRADPTFYAKAQAVFLRDTFASPVAIEQVQSLATRAFEEMKGLSAYEKTQLNRILADGMVDGSGAAEVARDMVDQIDGMTRTRALMIARTEIVRAHAEGQLDAFQAMGMEELGMEAEWSTADDDAVCDDCQDAADESPYTIDEARGMIPLHPNCRCAWIPMPIQEQQERVAPKEEEQVSEEEQAAEEELVAEGEGG